MRQSGIVVAIERERGIAWLRHPSGDPPLIRLEVATLADQLAPGVVLTFEVSDEGGGGPRAVQAAIAAASHPGGD